MASTQSEVLETTRIDYVFKCFYITSLDWWRQWRMYYRWYIPLNKPIRGQGFRSAVSARRRNYIFYFGIGVFKIKYILYHLSNRYFNILGSMSDRYFELMFIYKGVLWFEIYRKSFHGNKLNFIGWLQYLHIFANENIADYNLREY